METLKKKTVEKTVYNDLCVSCGVCKVICPIQCIVMKRNISQYVPNISNECISCGACLTVCPGWEVDYIGLYENEQQDMPKDIYVGNYSQTLMMWTHDITTRRNSVSGGTITSLINKLLNTNIYDAAFVLKDNKLNTEVKLEKLDKGENTEKTSKSRYIPVSIEKAIEYITKHPDEKVIIVGTGCVFHGLLKYLNRKKMNRENLLLLGLFCDRTLNNNLPLHFERTFNSNNEKIEEFYYRTKEKRGWPGDLKIVFDNNQEVHLDKSKRMRLKDHFQLNRCLFCLDKLNQFADISFGDHYVKGEETSLGANSVIVRTEKGQKIITKLKNEFQTYDSTIEEIKISQHIQNRKMNFEFSKKLFQKGINLYPGILKEGMVIRRKDLRILKERQRKLEIGKKSNESSKLLEKEMKKQELKNHMKFILKMPIKIPYKTIKFISKGVKK